jgi:PAS domain S-box-containing protein
MKNIKQLWSRFNFGFESDNDLMRKDIWTRDILRIMFLVVGISAGLILIGVLAGIFEFIGTLPIYIILVLIIAASVSTRYGGWRWARFIPILMCFGMGIYFSINSGLGATSLFYALAILLAGTLVGNKTRWIFFVLSIISYSYFVIDLHSFGLGDNLSPIITTFFLLLGISFLQGYYNNKLQNTMSDLIKGNTILKDEISLRKQAELASEKQESLYTRLADNTSDLVCEMALDGTIKYISPSYLPTLGYVPEYLVGTSVYDAVHPDDREKAFETERVIRSTLQINRVRLRVRHADGHYLHMEVSGSPLIRENNELFGYILSSRDITQQVIVEEAIKESEAKFRAIIESIPLGIHMYQANDNGGLIFTGYNPAADKVLGIDHSKLIGLSIHEAFPSLSSTELPGIYKSIAIRGGQWDQEQVKYNDDLVTGAFEVLAFQSSPNKAVVLFSDVSQRMIAAESLRVSEEKFSKAFVTSPDSININRLSDGMYIDINEGFTKITGYTREDVIGKTSLELDIWAIPAQREVLVKGLREMGVVNNLEAQFRFKDGSMSTGLMSARVIEIDNEKCIISITRDISDRKQAENDLLYAHAQLEEAYNATLEGWVRALEIREHDTADHSRRVVELTVSMATRMGFSGEELLHIQRGALLHDIGKMGVPDNILLKPGSLTAEEWTIMRYHPVYAHALLEEIEYLVPAMEIPYCHHERWDGKGYPRGLSSEEIPLSARIFAVIDVYDALLSDRPYRPAWSMDDVKQYLLDQKGKQFDPRVVDEFLSFITNN